MIMICRPRYACQGNCYNWIERKYESTTVKNLSRNLRPRFRTWKGTGRRDLVVVMVIQTTIKAEQKGQTVGGIENDRQYVSQKKVSSNRLKYEWVSIDVKDLRKIPWFKVTVYRWGWCQDINLSPQTNLWRWALYAPQRTIQSSDTQIINETAKKNRMRTFQRQETGLEDVNIIERQRS